MADLYGLFADPEAEARQKAAAMAQALRGQQGFGQLGVLTGDKVLGAYGQQQLADAARQQGFIAQAGQQRGQQNFTAGQAAAQQQAAGERLRAQLQAQEAARQQAQALKGQEDAGKRAKEARDIEERLRKEASGNAAYKQAQMAVSGLRQIETAANDGIGDIQRIFAYVNMIDPGSVVRDSDVVTLGRAGGLPGQAQAFFNQMTAQGTLPDVVRQQIQRSAKQIASSRARGAREVQDYFKGLAEKYGASPERVALPLGLELDEASPGTAPAGNVQPGSAPAAPAVLMLPNGRRVRRNPDGTYSPE